MKYFIEYILIFLFVGLAIGENNICLEFFTHSVELPAFSSPATYSPDAAFADFLFDKGLYSDAENEYERVAQLDQMTSAYDYAAYQRGICLIKMGKIKQAIDILDRLGYNAFDKDVSYRARLLRAISESALDMPRRGEFLLSDILRDMPEYSSEIYFWRGWLRLIQYDIDDATDDFDKVCNDNPRNTFYFPRAYGIKRWLDINIDDIPQHSEYLVRWLSGLLPGAGQTYAGKPGRGINSFLLNGSMGYLTIKELLAKNYLQGATIFTTLWNRYYFGGMIQAANMVNDFNKAQIDTAILTLIDTYIGGSTIVTVNKIDTSLVHDRKYFNGFSVCAEWTLLFYQNYITTQDAQECQFHPGCSDFSRISYATRNPFLATLMTSDRLQRCNPFAQKYYPEDSEHYLVDKLWQP
ncbi:hypothetical protein DRQ29_04310 [bacterium]|nr:MAG: hypothetical protein DRQ29_04310 [bacterium]